MAVLFIHYSSQTGPFASTTYTVPSTVNSSWVSGLKPSTGYTVTRTVTGSAVKVTISAGGATMSDAAGVLAF
jgi:hypothetical protein